MADNYFCLDIDEKFTKLLDSSKVGDFVQIDAIGRIETTDSFYTSNLEKSIDDQVVRITKLLEASKVTKKNVNIIIPDSLTYNQIITMPLLKEKELITAIKYQADQFIPMPIEETNIDIEVISEDQKEKKVLLLIVAAPKKVIERVQTTAELAGLNPESVENELSSNSRFANYFSKNLINQYKISQNQGIVIANFDSNSTSLSYYSSQELVIKEVHHLSIGYQLFLKETQVNTDTDIKKSEEMLRSYDKKNVSSYPIEKIVEPLVREFSSELSIFVNKYSSSTILFINKIVLFPALVSILTEKLGLPVNIIDPSQLLKKTQLTETYKNDLPFFIPTLGGNLR